MSLLTLSNRFYKSILLLVFFAFLLATGNATAAKNEKVEIRVFTPRENDLTGSEGTGYVIALRFKFPGDLISTGVTLPDLESESDTDAGGSNAESRSISVDYNEQGSESGANPDFPGLVVLLSNNKSGAGQNLAGFFTQISVSHRKYEDDSDDDAESESAVGATATHIWTSWQVDSEDDFGTEGEIEGAKLLVAVVDGDAPDEVEDMNDDGKLNRKDLKKMGYRILSEVAMIEFDVNGF